jgi:hypothetical protein
MYPRSSSCCSVALCGLPNSDVWSASRVPNACRDRRLSQKFAGQTIWSQSVKPSTTPPHRDFSRLVDACYESPARPTAGPAGTCWGHGGDIHKLRHYSATELINAGVDVRTVAGRLGHGGGGATTLRVYAAWLSEADQRAATALAGRMLASRSATTVEPGSNRANRSEQELSGPYAEIASDLRGAIRTGILNQGDALPTVKELGARYKVSAATAHRAVQLLEDEGLVEVSRGRRAVIA